MSFSFCFGPSGAGKSTYLRKMVIERAVSSLRGSGRDDVRYIFIVPEQYSMQTQRELVADHPAHVLMNIDVLSFGRLAYRVFKETGVDKRTVLDETGKSLLLRRVCTRCEKELLVLHRGIHRPGMIQEVKSILSEFMQYGIDVEQLAEMTVFAADHGQNALHARLKDMQLLYTEFKKEERDRYVTGEETLDLLADAIRSAKSLRGSVLVFDGFTGFTPVQYRVVKELIRCAGEVYFSFTVSSDQGPDISLTAAGGPAGRKQDLFYMTRRTVRDILKMANKEGFSHGEDIYLPCKEPAHSRQSDRVPLRFRKSPVLAHLERHLFRFPEAAYHCAEKERDGCGISLFAAASPQEEVRQIFARVRETIAKTGCAYRDFAIVTADLDTYGSLFELEAKRSGIPVYIDRTSGVFHNILIEGIRGALQIVTDQFSYLSVFRYLRSGLSRLTQKEVDLLENYCLSHGIRGRKKWSLPFDASCEEARIRFLKEVEPVTGSLIPEAAGQEASGRAPGRAAGQEASGRAPGRTAGERTRELYDFLVGCGAQERMQQLAGQFGSQQDVVRERQYLQIYRAVIDLLDQIHGLAGQERMSSRDYMELLEAGFSQIRLGTLPQLVDRILVGDMERTRLTQIRHLFFAAANEGNIPRNAARGGILSDMDREFLAGSGVELSPAPRQQIFTQRLYLYLNMTKPSESLTVSYASSSQDKKAMRPSYLVNMLQKLFPSLIVQNTQDLPVSRKIADSKGGQSILAEQLRCFAEGKLPPGTDGFDEFRLIYGFFTSPEVMADEKMRSSVLRLRRAALFRYEPQKLPEAITRALYGDRIFGGISRMETGARCLLWHHLRYGLHLQKRDLYEFVPADTGTILHAALQRFDAALRGEGLSWRDFTREDAVRLCRDAIGKETALYRDLIFYKSSRDETRISRFERRLLRTVDTLQYQIRKGDLDPVASEFSFGRADTSFGGPEFSSGKPGLSLPGSDISFGGQELSSGKSGLLLSGSDISFGGPEFSPETERFSDGALQQEQIGAQNAATEALMSPPGMPAIRFELGSGRRLVLSGRIDRVDLYVEAGRRYLRIIDYKSSLNDLDEDLVRRGLQVQLITYMEALRNADPGILDLLYIASGRAAAAGPPEAKKGLPSIGVGKNMSEPSGGGDVRQPSSEAGESIEGISGGGTVRQPFLEAEEVENIPSALLYYRMAEPVVSMSAKEAMDAAGGGLSPHRPGGAVPAASDEGPWLQSIRKELRPRGLVYGIEESIGHLDRTLTANSSSDVIPAGKTKTGFTRYSRIIDPVRYRELAQAAKDAVCRTADLILDGNLAASPAVLDKKNRLACAFCPYQDACGFDLHIPGYRARREM